MNRILIATALLLIPCMSHGVERDLSGTWTFVATDAWNKGPCPAGPAGAGEVKLEQKGDEITLVFTAGRVCKPASMCTFKGKLTGKKLTLGNSATVDSEGGKVKNSISLTVKDAKSASGSSASTYAHPGGMVCSWGSKLAIKKK